MDDRREQGATPRLLFVSHDSKLNGAPLSLLYTMQWLADRAARVQAATIGEGGLVERLERDGTVVDVLPAPADYRTGPRTQVFDVFRRQFGKAVNAIRLARIARRSGADLVYVNSVSRLTNIVGAWLSRKPVVVHVREVENYLEPESPLRRWVLRFVLRLPERFIADSNATRRVLLRVHPGATVDVVHNGVDPLAIASGDEARRDARKRLGLDPERTVVGFVGRRSLRKGFDVFRKAAAAVRARDDRVRIAVIGDRDETVPEPGPDIPDLVEQGFIDDIGKAYVAFDIFVMASRHEPFARVNLEASAAGCAIVATAVDGNVELFTHEHDALLVPPGEADAMAEAIQRLVDDASLRTRLGDAAQKLVREHYTLDICHQKILNNIADLLPSGAVVAQAANQRTGQQGNDA